MCSVPFLLLWSLLILSGMYCYLVHQVQCSTHKTLSSVYVLALNTEKLLLMVVVVECSSSFFAYELGTGVN